jgi:hypothetical protein
MTSYCIKRRASVKRPTKLTDEAQHVLNGGQRGGWVQHHTRLAAQVLDLQSAHDSSIKQGAAPDNCAESVMSVWGRIVEANENQQEALPGG